MAPGCTGLCSSPQPSRTSVARSCQVPDACFVLKKISFGVWTDRCVCQIASSPRRIRCMTCVQSPICARSLAADHAFAALGSLCAPEHFCAPPDVLMRLQAGLLSANSNSLNSSTRSSGGTSARRCCSTWTRRGAPGWPPRCATCPSPACWWWARRPGSPAGRSTCRTSWSSPAAPPASCWETDQAAGCRAAGAA
jgi:hypothetical protein